MRSFIIWMSFASVASVRAGDEIPPPKALQTVTTALAKAVVNGHETKLKFRIPETKIEFREGSTISPVQKVIDGKTVIEWVREKTKVAVPAPNGFRDVELPVRTLRVTDLAGNHVAIATLTERLSDFTPVLVNVDSKEPVDKFWTLTAKPDTLIFYFDEIYLALEPLPHTMRSQLGAKTVSPAPPESPPSRLPSAGPGATAKPTVHPRQYDPALEPPSLSPNSPQEKSKPARP